MNYDMASYILGSAVPLMGGHGVEYIHSNRDTTSETLGLSYVNMGDPYAETLIYDHQRKVIFTRAWGDAVEEQPYRFDYDRYAFAATMLLALIQDALPQLEDYDVDVAGRGADNSALTKLIERIEAAIKTAEELNI